MCSGRSWGQLDWSLPAASLNNPMQSVHSGVCGSASSLSPEAVNKKEWRTYVAFKFDSLLEYVISSVYDAGHAADYIH